MLYCKIHKNESISLLAVLHHEGSIAILGRKSTGIGVQDISEVTSDDPLTPNYYNIRLSSGYLQSAEVVLQHMKDCLSLWNLVPMEHIVNQLIITGRLKTTK